MRIRINATSNYGGFGNYVLEKYPQLNKYKPIFNEDKEFETKELTIEITPEEVFKLAKELDEKIIIIPDWSIVEELKVSLEIYDDWRE